MIRIELYDAGGVLIDEFSDWHPLLAFVETAPGGPSRREMFNEGGAVFIIPFRSDVAQINIVDVKVEQELVDVDPGPVICKYCVENTDDPDCAEIGSTTICSTLGNNRISRLPDKDSFLVNGEKGEELTIKVEEGTNGNIKKGEAMLFIAGKRVFDYEYGLCPINKTIRLSTKKTYVITISEYW